MKCSAFIATSADGYIADLKGGIDWLYADIPKDAATCKATAIEENPDLGFKEYISTVDCMVMGRKCMEVISSMNLAPEQWPYGDIEIIVLSKTIKEPPQNLADKVTMYGGEIKELMQSLKNKGRKHAYIDGGTTITSFINLKLINTMTVTQAPILLGSGLPLFGFINEPVALNKIESITYSSGFVQTKYDLLYS
jgi:dihydrofolate reductase